jgi:hypothetical protein
MMIFWNVSKISDEIIKFITKLEKKTESEISFMIRVMNFKDMVKIYRQKYVLATWRPDDSQRLHNEMTVDVSNLVKEHSEIGKLWRQVKALRKYCIYLKTAFINCKN